MTVFDGLDLGWTYTSSLATNITHDLSVVSDTRSKGVKKAFVGDTVEGRLDRQDHARRGRPETTDQTYYALSAEPDQSRAAEEAARDAGSCQPLEHDDLWDYNDNLASRVDKPDNCFRMTVDHGLERNYLDAYTVTLAPQGADVAWGGIAWKAWKDLTCGSMDFVAMEQVDVCAMFADEVDALPTPKAVAVVLAAGEDVGSNLTGATLAGFNLDFDGAAAARHQFTDMWYARGKEMPPPNLYADSTGDGGDADTDPDDMVRGAADGRGVWVATLDKDFDPIYGDIGKVDNGVRNAEAAPLGGDDEADNFAADDDSFECSADDGGSAATGKDGADLNGTLCNANDVEIATSVTFPLGLGYGCDPIKVEYTLTCNWDSRGNRTNTLGATLAEIADDGTNIGMFVKCSVE